MVGQINDGGPAFPSTRRQRCPNCEAPISPRLNGNGMTLRDWFAGQAVATARGMALSVEGIAKHAYELADQMIAERERGGSSK